MVVQFQKSPMINLPPILSNKKWQKVFAKTRFDMICPGCGTFPIKKLPIFFRQFDVDQHNHPWLRPCLWCFSCCRCWRCCRKNKTLLFLLDLGLVIGISVRNYVGPFEKCAASALSPRLATRSGLTCSMVDSPVWLRTCYNYFRLPSWLKEWSSNRQ